MRRKGACEWISRGDKNLAADVIESNGAVVRWLQRECQVYNAHHGRDGTADGFKEHIRTLLQRHPEITAQFLLDCADATFGVAE
jgi:hypothetical protein